MLNKLFHQPVIPPEYRANFQHLYFDIAWYGVLSGSAVNFLNIYAARLGASALQIGLIGAMSAIVNLLLAIPAGRWLQKQNTSRAIFWTSVYHRSGFIMFIFLPMVFHQEQAQITAIIVTTFIMAIPLTPLGVGFNALFAEAVPERYRAHVAGIRNIMLSVTFMTTSLISGWILDNLTFPIGYQIVFGIGALGAAMSSFHLYFVRPLQADLPSPLPSLKPDSTSQTVSPRNLFTVLRLDIWKTDFRRVLLVLGGFHLAQFIAIPIFPLYYINGLHLNDDHIGIGSALFYLTVLLGSTQLRKVVQRMGNKNLTGWGVLGLAVYPFVLARSSEVWQFYAISLFGGFIFSMVNGAYANYMLEHIPATDRPPYLAWYNIVLNAAILIGSLLGPAVADHIGLTPALILFACVRFLAGVFIIKWG